MQKRNRQICFLITLGLAVGGSTVLSGCAGTKERAAPGSVLLSSALDRRLPVIGDLDDAHKITQDIGTFYDLFHRWPVDKPDLFDSLRREQKAITSTPERFNDLRISVEPNGRHKISWMNDLGQLISIELSAKR
jgi:hypothetical protein